MKRIWLFIFLLIPFLSNGQIVSGRVGVFRDSIYVNGRWYSSLGGGGGIGGVGQDGYIPVWKGSDSLSYFNLKYSSSGYNNLIFGSDSFPFNIFLIHGSINVLGSSRINQAVLLDSSNLFIRGSRPFLQFNAANGNAANISLDSNTFYLQPSNNANYGLKVNDVGDIDLGWWIYPHIPGLNLFNYGFRVNVPDTFSFVSTRSFPVYSRAFILVYDNTHNSLDIDTQLINLPYYFGEGGFFYVYKDDSVGALNKGHAVWLSVDSLNEKFPIGNQFSCLDLRDTSNPVSATISNEVASYSIQKYNAATVDTFYLPDPAVSGGIIKNGFQATVAYELCAAGASFVVVYNPSAWTFAAFNCSNCTEPSNGIVKVTAGAIGTSGVLNIKVFQGKKLIFY